MAKLDRSASNGLPPGEQAQAAHAWRRFRRIVAGATLVGLLAAALAVWLVGRSYGTLGWIATFAMFGGVVGSLAMAGALMGLAFMSSGTGHDEAVQAFEHDPDTPDPRYVRERDRW